MVKSAVRKCLSLLEGISLSRTAGKLRNELISHTLCTPFFCKRHYFLLQDCSFIRKHPSFAPRQGRKHFFFSVKNEWPILAISAQRLSSAMGVILSGRGQALPVTVWHRCNPECHFQAWQPHGRGRKGFPKYASRSHLTFGNILGFLRPVCILSSV